MAAGFWHMCTKMGKKEDDPRGAVEVVVDIPEGTSVDIGKNLITTKGERGELSKDLKTGKIKVSKKDNKIILSSESSRRKDISLLGTLRGSIKNMVHGVSDGIKYKLRIVYSHFPMSIKVQGNKVVIENFLGEKYPRRADILEGVNVEVTGQDVAVSGIDKENVAQTAANIEQATRIKDLDPRVFQDGCYIVEKDGKPLRG